MRALSYAALWLFVFTVPWQGLVLTSGAALANKITGIIVLGLAVFVVVLSGRVRRWNFFHVAALLFVAYTAVEFFLFHSGETLPNKFYTFLQLFLVLLAVWELAPSSSRQRGLLTSYVLGAYVGAVSNILLLRSQGAQLRRVAAAGADPNDLAMTLALALPMAWYLGMTSRNPLVRWIGRAYLPIGIFSIALTASRGGMVASIVALLIVPLTMTKLSPGRLAGAIAMLGLAGALAVMYVPEHVVERLASTGSSVQDLSLGGRFKLWVAGIHAFTQKPVFGWGTSGYKLAISPEMGQSSQVAHNTFVSVLVEQGAIGFLLFVLVLVAVFRAVLTMPSFERRFALTLFATLGVAMLPLTWENSKPTWVVMALLVGLARSDLMGARPMPSAPRMRQGMRAPWRAGRPGGPLLPGRHPQPDGRV